MRLSQTYMWWRSGLLAVLLLCNAAATAQANAAITVKWKDQLVGNEDVMLARLVGDKVESHSARSSAEAKASFKGIPVGEWTLLTAAAARAQAKLNNRLIGGLVGKALTLKDGDNQFEVDTGEYGFTQLELKVAWPAEADFGRFKLHPLGHSEVIQVLENPALYLAWPGPHRLECIVQFKREISAATDRSEALFELALSIPESPASVIEPAINFSRTKFKWKLPPEAKGATVDVQLARIVPRSGNQRAVGEEGFTLFGEGEKDVGLLPFGRYSMHATAILSADEKWHIRRDVEFGKADETIDLDFKSPSGELAVGVSIKGDGWDNTAQQPLLLRLVQSGKGTGSATVWLSATDQQPPLKGLALGKWTYEVVCNGCLALTGSVEVKSNAGKLDLKLKRGAGMLVTVSGATSVSYRWEFESEDGRRLATEASDGTNGVANRQTGDNDILIYGIPKGATRIRFKIVGKADIVLKVSDAPGKLQKGTIEIPQ